MNNTICKACEVEEAEVTVELKKIDGELESVPMCLKCLVLYNPKKEEE